MSDSVGGQELLSGTMIDISFTTRLQNIMALKLVVKEVNQDLDDQATTAQAKQLESSIFNRVTSEDGYEQECTRQIEALRSRTQPPQRATDEAKFEGLDPGGPDLGPYARLTYHKNGLFSTVFKCLAKEGLDEGKGSPSSLIALKVTTPSVMKAPHNSEREARILEEARCEHVVPLLASLWQSGGRLVLAFPFMSLDLETLIRNSTIDQANVRDIICDLFKALCHLHSLDIIHRDVKASNILLKSSTGPAYLADFGIAWSPSDPDSEAVSHKITDVGTTSYRPPELLFGWTAYDTSLDLWAAGCTIAEMVRPSHQSVFYAGDLGSELALIKSIFSTLGTPTEMLWPSVKRFPDWGKMRFVDYPAIPWAAILTQVPHTAVDFVSCLIQYEGSRRMTASQALEHDFLSERL